MSSNLLFIYGTSGAGKTRLLMRINEALYGVQEVSRVGIEQILDEMVRSLALGTYSEFFSRYTKIRNLLVDNLWVLRSRPNAAKELEALIEARVAFGNLTVIASDLLPDEVNSSLPGIGRCLQQNNALHLNIGWPKHITLEQRLALFDPARHAGEVMANVS